MSQEKEFKELARRAYISYHEDGLIDVLLGLGILGFGLMLLTGNVIFNILAWMPMVFYVPLKNRITIPRFGYAQFMTEQKKRNYLWLAVAVGVVAFALFLGLFVFLLAGQMPVWMENFLGRYDLLLLGLLLDIPLVIGGMLSGLNRLYAYALLVLAVIAGGIILGLDAPFYFIFLGSVILSAGIWLLVRFLRKYPLENRGRKTEN